jgi:hypothetical protein
MMDGSNHRAKMERSAGLTPARTKALLGEALDREAAKGIQLHNVLSHQRSLRRRLAHGQRVTDEDLAHFERFCAAVDIAPSILR